MHLHTRRLQNALCHRNLAFGLLAEADTNGVANAVDEQCANANSTFQSAVLAFARFCHAEVQRIVHAFLLHLPTEQADALDHDDGVRSLNADHHITELLAFGNAQELHARLHNAFGRIAIARHDAVGERTMVHTDADGSAVFATDIKETAEAFVQTGKFLTVLLVGIFQSLELAGRVHIVAGIDAYLLHDCSGNVGHIRVEVNVGTERNVSIATFREPRLDVAQVLCLASALGSKANQLSACLNDADGLRYATFGVERGACCHTLHRNTVLTTNTQFSYLYFVCLSSHHIIYHLFPLKGVRGS